MFTRRSFLALTGAAIAAGRVQAQDSGQEPVIDIHQHTNYHGRSNEGLFAHQKNMGVTKTVLLPAGSKFGLAANAGGNDTVVPIAHEKPTEYVFFANELPDIPETKAVLEKYIKAGAIGIGEQKFHVECDSPEMQGVYDIARDHHVPVLMHFQYHTYNMGFERLYKMLEKYPTVNFIAHAQTFWLNISKDADQTMLYPKGPVTPGGISERYLSDYANFWGDLSAGSGLNALRRDEEFTRGFLSRHQNKLLYGSDCEDVEGAGPKCSGAQQMELVRRLAPDHAAVRKMLHDNAARLLKI